jgi:hypothetical protein
LKAVNLYGDAEINHITDWRMPSLVKQAAEAQAKAEGLSEEPMPMEDFLIEVNKNPDWRHRVEEIEADLWDQYGADDA